MPGVELPVIGSRADQPAEVEDPCFGKQKEFFIYELNDKKNVCICRYEQMSFIAANYPEYYKTPIDILVWLYDAASHAEDLLAEQAVYSAPKSNQEKMEDEVDNEDEETKFVKSQKDRTKPLVKPSIDGPANKPMSEKDKIKRLDQMNLQKMEENQFKKEEVIANEDVNEDPCHGLPKEFFIYELNQMAYVCICTHEQLSFISKHYPLHYWTPIETLIWLYDVASYAEYLLSEKEDTIAQKRASNIDI